MLKMRLTVWRDDESKPILDLPGLVIGGLHWDGQDDPIIDNDYREIHGISVTADIREPKRNR